MGPGRQKTTRAGFSLVELLLVLALIGVMAGSVAVALHGRTAPHALRTSAEDLAAALRYARHEAIGTGRSHRVTFANDRQSYRIEAVEPGGEAVWAPANGIAGKDHRFGPNVVLVLAQDGQASVVGDESTALLCEFGPDGDGFSGAIRLRNAALDEAVIEVLSRTGQVRIAEGGRLP